MAGAAQAGCSSCCAAFAAAGLLWFAVAPAAADEVDARALDTAFDACLADPHVTAATDRPEAIQWNPPATPVKVHRKMRKPRGAETTLHDDVRVFCPELYWTIDRSRFAVMLPEDWGDYATPRKLQRLRALMTAKGTEPAHRLETGSVPGIVKDIETTQAAREMTLWEKFRAWLKGILERRSGKKESNWLADWLEKHKPSEEVMAWIGYGLLVLLVGGALWIVYSELRAAGLLGRWSRRKSRVSADARTAPAARRATSLADAGDEEQPALLIALLLEQLRRLGRIQDRLSMTHRELASAAKFDSPDDRETFSSLIGVAEKLRYAAIAPARAQLRQAIDAAKLLLSRLLQPPRSAA